MASACVCEMLGHLSTNCASYRIFARLSIVIRVSSSERNLYVYFLTISFVAACLFLNARLCGFIPHDLDGSINDYASDVVVCDSGAEASSVDAVSIMDPPCLLQGFSPPCNSVPSSSFACDLPLKECSCDICDYFNARATCDCCDDRDCHLEEC